MVVLCSCISPVADRESVMPTDNVRKLQTDWLTQFELDECKVVKNIIILVRGKLPVLFHQLQYHVTASLP